MTATRATLPVLRALLDQARRKDYLSGVLAWGLAGHIVAVFLGEVSARHASSNAAAAAHLLLRGRYATLFWSALMVGGVIPLGMLVAGPRIMEPVASLLALFGLLGYEHAFVMAGQAVPIS